MMMRGDEVRYERRNGLGEGCSTAVAAGHFWSLTKVDKDYELFTCASKPFDERPNICCFKQTQVRIMFLIRKRIHSKMHGADKQRDVVISPETYWLKCRW